MDKLKKNNLKNISVSHMVEDIVGCKWSLSVLKAVRNQIIRPGEIQRSINGISTKVLNERFTKMIKYGILEKKLYSEIPPKVEYSLTNFGEKFVVILDQIDTLQNEVLKDEKD